MILADYLSLRSRFFEALFSSPLRESKTRVVQLTPPCVKTLVCALHHLYTGALSSQHVQMLDAAINQGDAETFWGLYENASFLDCPSLTRECMAVLGLWLTRAQVSAYSFPIAFGRMDCHLPAPMLQSYRSGARCPSQGAAALPIGWR